MIGNREDIEIINLTNKHKFWNPEIIKFQSAIREILKDSPNKQFNITCGNFVVGESEDSVHGYDFIVSVEKGGKKGILLVSVMHKWKDGPTSVQFTDWGSAVEKLLSKKELINIIAVIPMSMGKPYIEKSEKDKITIMPIDKFKEEIIKVYKPWKPELLERWEQDEIYLRPIKYVGNKEVQNNPWIKDYQKLLKEILEESKSYNGRPKASGGYDLISNIKGKEILIEAKGKTWIKGPPSLLLNVWLKSVKHNFLLQAENKDIHEVIGVVPLGENIWRFPSASKNIQMMSLEQFANYIANAKNKPELLNEWKDRISKILREMELHTIEDPPTEPKQPERGKLAIKELEKDTSKIGSDDWKNKVISKMKEESEERLQTLASVLQKEYLVSYRNKQEKNELPMSEQELKTFKEDNQFDVFYDVCRDQIITKLYGTINLKGKFVKKILIKLMKRSGRMYTANDIIDLVWSVNPDKPDDAITDNACEKQISNLCSLLQRGRSGPYIKRNKDFVRGYAYYFSDKVTYCLIEEIPKKY